MIQRTLRIVAAVALLAAPFVLRAQDPTACQAGERELTSLKFDGNHQFESAVLANGISTSPSAIWRRLKLPFGKRRCLDQVEFVKDYLRLLVLYRASGFREVRIDTLVVRSPTSVKVTFKITEGVPVIVDTLRIIGLDSVADRATIVEHLPLRLGDPFNRYRIDATRDTLTRRLQDNGYPAAFVGTSTRYPDSASRRAQVEYTVEPGTRAVLGEISVEITPKDAGTQPKISEGTARKFLGVKAGDPYRESSLERAKKNLYLTQLYSSVIADVDSNDVKPPGDSVVRFHVALTEDDMRSARVGGGYGTLDCGRVEGEFTHLNFLSSARRFDLRARASKIGIGQPLSGAEALCYKLRDDPYSVDLNYNLSFSLTEPTPSLFGTQPSATIFSERRGEFKAYLRQVPVGLLLSTARQGRRRSLSFSYTAEYGRTEAQPAIFCALQNLCVAEDREPLLQNHWTATLGAAVVQHWFDDPQYATRRATLQVELRHASRFIGSDPTIQFNRGTADLSGEISLGREFVLAARVRGGAVVGATFVGSSKFIPAQERMFAGGGQTVRGFGQNDLGPKVYIASGYDTVRAEGAGETISPDEQVFFRTRDSVAADRSVPTGGSAVVIGNLELRIPSPWLHDRIQFATFLDAGEVWSPGAARPEDRFSKLKYTPGVGVRVSTPIGVLRLDLAYNPYAPRAGSAYFDTPISQGGQLYCVSPGNTLAVTGLGRPDAPPEQESGACVASFNPPARNGFLRKLQLTFGIGQAY